MQFPVLACDCQEAYFLIDCIFVQWQAPLTSINSCNGWTSDASLLWSTCVTTACTVCLAGARLPLHVACVYSIYIYSV